MIRRIGKNKKASMDFQRFERDASTLINYAIPYGKEIVCEGPSTTETRYDLSNRIHESANQIVSNILTEGKAHWCLNINPKEDSEPLFCFRPRKHPVQGFKTIPMIIRSRDIGIPYKHIRSLTKRLRHSEFPLSDLTLLRFDIDRNRIADRWGHALSWHMSDPSVFTDACILLNQCNKKLLAIETCKAVETAMNKALSKSGFSDSRVTIPTYSKEKLKSSKKRYIEGSLEEEAFNNLVFSS